MGVQFVQVYAQIKCNLISTAAQKMELKAAKECVIFKTDSTYRRQDAIDGYTKAEEILDMLFSASNPKGQKLLDDIRRKRRIAERGA
jgi:hypothetical protein